LNIIANRRLITRNESPETAANTSVPIPMIVAMIPSQGLLAEVSMASRACGSGIAKKPFQAARHLAADGVLSEHDAMTINGPRENTE
jgi:hypothetical protein